MVPVNFRSQNFSKPSASTSLLRIARLPSRLKVISLSRPSMRSWIQAFCAGSEMCIRDRYHLGASSDREFDGNKVHLSLTANPSHLEIVDPVVLGKVLSLIHI